MRSPRRRPDRPGNVPLTTLGVLLCIVGGGLGRSTAGPPSVSPLEAEVDVAESAVTIRGTTIFPDGHTIYFLLREAEGGNNIERGATRVRQGGFEGRIRLRSDRLPPGEWTVVVYTWPPGESGTPEASRIEVRVPLRTGTDAEIEAIRNRERPVYRDRFDELDRIREDLQRCWPVRNDDPEQESIWRRMQQEAERLTGGLETFRETAAEAAVGRRFDPFPDTTRYGIFVSRELLGTISEIEAERAGAAYQGPYDRDWKVVFTLAECRLRIAVAREKLGSDRKRAGSAALRADLETLATLRKSIEERTGEPDDPDDPAAWEDWSRGWIASVVLLGRNAPAYAEGELAEAGIDARIEEAASILAGWWYGVDREVRARTGGNLEEETPALASWRESTGTRPIPIGREAAVARLDAIDAELEGILRERGREVGATLATWAGHLETLIPPCREAAEAALEGGTVPESRIDTTRNRIEEIRIEIITTSDRDFRVHSPTGGEMADRVASRLLSILRDLSSWETLDVGRREAFRSILPRIETGNGQDLTALREEIRRLQDPPR